MRSGPGALLLFTAGLACADSRFRIAVMPRPEITAGKGQCDIRLEIDNEVEVTIRRDAVLVRTVSGKDALDDGSDCNMALPAADVPNFAVQKVDDRGDLRIVQRPSARNDYALVLRIVDAADGVGRYHFRLSWDAAPGVVPTVETPPAPRRKNDNERLNAPPGFVWNNATEYRGAGTGESLLNQSTSQKLGEVRAAIDLGGKIVVSFGPDPPRGPRGGQRRPIVFTGSLISREGARIRASVTTEDQRLRGTMVLSVDEAHAVNSITLDATNGQDRLHLTWDRK